MGEWKKIEFTANMYMDVYRSHIASLDKLESKQKSTFHTMMACYVTAGTFTQRESGDQSTRTKQEGKGSECKLRRVT